MPYLIASVGEAIREDHIIWSSQYVLREETTSLPKGRLICIYCLSHMSICSSEPPILLHGCIKNSDALGCSADWTFVVTMTEVIALAPMSLGCCEE